MLTVLLNLSSHSTGRMVIMSPMDAPTTPPTEGPQPPCHPLHTCMDLPREGVGGIEADPPMADHSTIMGLLVEDTMVVVGAIKSTTSLEDRHNFSPIFLVLCTNFFFCTSYLLLCFFCLHLKISHNLFAISEAVHGHSHTSWFYESFHPGSNLVKCFPLVATECQDWGVQPRQI